MIKIEVRNTQVNEKSITYKTGEKAGQTSIRFLQSARLHGHYVQGFKAEDPALIILELGEKTPANPTATPYAPGMYVISDECYYPGRFADIQFGRLKLTPLAQFVAEFQNEFKTSLKAAA